MFPISVFERTVRAAPQQSAKHLECPSFTTALRMFEKEPWGLVTFIDTNDRELCRKEN
jgi:hypothetical protein